MSYVIVPTENRNILIKNIHLKYIKAKNRNAIKREEILMNLIFCNEECIYQKVGSCELSCPAELSENIECGCSYFKKRKSNIAPSPIAFYANDKNDNLNG